MYVSQKVFMNPNRKRNALVAHLFSELPVTTKPMSARLICATDVLIERQRDCPERRPNTATD